MAHTGKFVAIYRVSTKDQESSGLGLAAQQSAVKTYLNGGDWRLLKEFTEVMSGTKKGDRHLLNDAVNYCKMTDSTLIFAKFDRLTRDLSTLCALRDTGVRFMAVDNPNASDLTVNILISVAEEEARMISDRTRKALAEAKARGTVLGGYKGGPVPDHRAATAVRQAKADGFAELVGQTVRNYRDAGMTLREIAAKLAEDDIQTARGGAWTATAVKNVLDRLNG